MLEANIPTVSSENKRQDSRCPKDATIIHCSCHAKHHSCGFCGENW